VKTLFKKDTFWLLLVIVVSVISIYPLFHKGFYSFHDEAHIANLYEMTRGISMGEIPPRWSPDFSYNFGLPFFNFYYLFPFYLGAFFYLIFKISLFWSLKLVFLLSVPFSGMAFYFLMKKYFSKITAFSGAVIYMFTPYRAVDLYVRGAVGELWGFVAMPLVLLGYVNLIEKRNLKNFLLCSIALAFLIITHNLTLVIFSPIIFAAGCFLLISSQKKLSSLVSVFLATLFGLLISAYYWLPAMMEKKYMQPGTPFNPFDHFPFIKQLLFPSWGYGVSTWGPYDGMSFQIGIVNLLLIILVSISLLFFWEKILSVNKKMMITFVLLFFSYLFLMNIRSSFIWKILPLGEYLQFPWRALTVTTFLSSFFVGFIECFPFKKLSKTLPVLLAVLSVILTFQYFKPQKYLEVTDNYYLKRFFADRVSSGKSEKESLEYANWTESYIPLTIWTEKRPESLPGKKIEMEDGIISYKEVSPINLEVEIQAKKESEVIVNNYYFPGWKAFVDGKETEIKILEPLGNMSVPVVAGEHKMSVNFSETFIRSLADKISLFSIMIIFLLPFLQKFKKLKFP